MERSNHCSCPAGGRRICGHCGKRNSQAKKRQGVLLLRGMQFLCTAGQLPQKQIINYNKRVDQYHPLVLSFLPQPPYTKAKGRNLYALYLHGNFAACLGTAVLGQKLAVQYGTAKHLPTIKIPLPGCAVWPRKKGPLRCHCQYPVCTAGGMGRPRAGGQYYRTVAAASIRPHITAPGCPLRLAYFANTIPFSRLPAPLPL